MSPETISKISDGHMDEAWVRELAEVDKREATHKRKASAASPSKASQELGPLLEKLVLKVGLARLKRESPELAKHPRLSCESVTFWWHRSKP